jgi:hypothetical protein
MKITRLLFLAALVVGLLAAIGPASATAESTQMCTTDTEPCTSPATSFHLTGTGATLLTSLTNVECSALYSGSTSGTLGSSQSLKGTLTLSGCKDGKGSSCEAKQLEEEKPGEIERSGFELGWWHYHLIILWQCPSFHCVYAFWLWWHFLGPLKEGGTNGKLTVSEEVKKVSGLFCPSTAKFDSTLESLTPIYMKA